MLQEASDLNLIFRTAESETIKPKFFYKEAELGFNPPPSKQD
jgi:hypothetical protein